MPASPLSSTTWPSPAIARCQRRNISRFEAVIEAFGRLPAREDLRVRLGIATGLAVVGDLLGEGATQERGVVGETPNLAARLQALAAPNTSVISDAPRRRVGALFDLADLGPARDQRRAIASISAIVTIGQPNILRTCSRLDPTAVKRSMTRTASWMSPPRYRPCTFRTE